MGSDKLKLHSQSSILFERLGVFDIDLPNNNIRQNATRGFRFFPHFSSIQNLK